jgi:malonyl-CoA O-methyltransferase
VKPVDRPVFKNRIATSFGSKVSRYTQNAVIQQKLLGKLLPNIIHYCRQGDLWADIGCGNGALERDLSLSGFSGRMIGFDIARQSLKFCSSHCTDTSEWICGDIEHAPFKPSTFNGLISASVLQWACDLEKSIMNISTLLKPDGIFIFSLFTEGSFRELFETRRLFGIPVHLKLPRQLSIEATLAANNFSSLATENFAETIFFPSAWRLLQHLSAIGSTGVHTDHLSRTGLKHLCSIFETTFGTQQGVPLTYKALLGTAQKRGQNG